MADTVYQYVISAAFPNGKVDGWKLQKQVEDSVIASANIIYINSDVVADICDIWFDDPLSISDQVVLDGIVTAHNGDPYVYPFSVPAADSPADTHVAGDFWWDGVDGEFYGYDGVGFRPVSYKVWNRDVGGFLYPSTTTDDLGIGAAGASGRWLDNGSLVLGGNVMAGTERLRVNGSSLIDQNGNAVGLDIDSEATGAPLINLQGLNGNSRGDVAFGTARTGDPSAPSQGDLWYEATSGELKFRKAASTVEVRNAIKLQGRVIASTAPTDGQAMLWSTAGSQWQPGSVTPYSAAATATASTTTTSTSDVLVGSMTVTPAAGTYLVWFAGSVSHGTNNAYVYTSIFAGGVQAAASQMTMSDRWSFTGGAKAFTAVARVTVNGSQAIEGRWSTSTGTATMYARTLMILRVA